MNYSNIPSAQSLILLLKANGIKDIVISPGSRNAPLIIGFSEDPFFTCFSIVDERSAAFFGLGIAQQQRQPVALVCTSGSAVLNYYPAISEAFYSHIPLVVISADRPGYKVDIGDGQTIRQSNVFDLHIGYSANLKQDVVHATQKIRQYNPEQLVGESLEIVQQKVQAYNNEQVNMALHIALRNASPVHINIPFEEPLYGTTTTPSVKPTKPLSEKKETAYSEKFEAFIDLWNSSKRKLIIIGVNYPNTFDAHLLERLGTDPSIMVFTETTSNVHHANFFPSIDSIIAPIEKSENRIELFQRLQPELVVTFGGQIVSKKVKAFLRQYKPHQHWHVGKQKADNTFFSLSKHFKCDENTFLNYFLNSTPSHSDNDYREYWSAVKVQYEKKRLTYLEQLAFSDMSVFGVITSSIPKNYQVHLANSSTVRYTQLFDLDATLQVFCNRGTSGIDGSTSTAIGGAVYSKTPTLLISGDLSFFYDSNGFWNRYIRPDFRIIVINNNGGGIFRILPGQEDTDNFETYFETTHGLSVAHLCNMYSIGYQFADSEIELKRTLNGFYERSTRPQLLEIRTPRLLNNKILLGYFDFIS